MFPLRGKWNPLNKSKNVLDVGPCVGPQGSRLGLPLLTPNLCRRCLKFSKMLVMRGNFHPKLATPCVTADWNEWINLIRITAIGSKIIVEFLLTSLDAILGSATHVILVPTRAITFFFETSIAICCGHTSTARNVAFAVHKFSSWTKSHLVFAFFLDTI